MSRSTPCNDFAGAARRYSEALDGQTSNRPHLPRDRYMTSSSQRARAVRRASVLAASAATMILTLSSGAVAAATPVLTLPHATARIAPLSPLEYTEQKVVASNGQPHDAFGEAIAISGTTALI